MATPNSYKDPFWANVSTQAESKHGLPSGLLTAIFTHGEKSNNDQISSADARTPFQIIKPTRDLFLKKYGIDAYLSPENAAEVGALHVKESLSRNNGDIGAAVSEYHAGPNRVNWGPITKAYTERVLSKFKPQDVEAKSNAPQPRSFAKETQANKPASIDGMYKAYTEGKMQPDEVAVFEDAVRSGKLMLPRGAAIAESPKPQASQRTLPPSAIDAYHSGAMSAEEKSVVDSAIKSGELTALPPLPTMGQKIGDIFTGNLRKTQETETLPEWVNMPELNQLSGASFKSGLGTLLAPTAEIPQIIKSQFPGLGVRQDEKGNAILKSTVDGKEYAIPPGITWGDLPRIVGGVAAFTPAGQVGTSIPKLAAASAGTQAVIEGTQAAAGGEFSPSEVAIAGVGAPVGVGVARGIGMASNGVKNVLQKAVTGKPATIAADMATPAGAIPATPSVTPSFTQAGVEQTAEQIASVAKKAVAGMTGKAKATDELAGLAKPDPVVVEAAKKLKMELDPDHVTSSDQYRKLVGLARSQAGSDAEARGISAVEKASSRADEVMGELGASKDLATISDKVKAKLGSTRDEMESASDALYKEVDAAIPGQTPVKLNALSEYLSGLEVKLGGQKGFSSAEKTLSGLLDDAQSITYARLARERGLIGKALQGKESPYGSMAEGDLKQLYKALASDQLDAVSANGGNALRDKYRLATQTVAQRKALEKRIVETFGKDNNGSLVPALRNSINAATRGDDKGLTKLIKAIPEPLRKEALSSALLTHASATTKGGQFGFSQYSKMYKGMRDNPPVYNAVVKTLGNGADELLTDLYKVSQGIAKAQAAILHTGKANQGMKEVFSGPESLVTSILDNATRAAARGAVTEGATSMAVGPTGAGFLAGAVQALRAGNKDTLRAAGDLMTSPEFKELVAKAATKQPTEKQVARLARSHHMNRFSKLVKAEYLKDVSERERWINAALQSQQAPKSEKQL